MNLLKKVSINNTQKNTFLSGTASFESPNDAAPRCLKSSSSGIAFFAVTIESLAILPV